MAQQINDEMLEIPEGYTPKPFTPAQVRNLYDIRSDFSTDPEQWMDDLIDTITEIHMPSEELYQQEENLRILSYRIDHTTNDPALRESLINGREELLDRYAAYRVNMEARIEEDILAETKRRYLANLNIIVDEKKFKPEDDIDVQEDAISEEMLLQGYQPVPFKSKNLRSVEEQREIFETVPEGEEQPVAVDEEAWALDMQEIIAEEVMPASLLHGQEEALRKLQYQIDTLNENQHVADMVEPYEIIEPDESMLSPEDYKLAVLDQLYKEDLNRRFAKRVQLEKDRDDLLDMIVEDRFAWQKELDQRMEQELALRQENLIRHEEFLREQRELAEEEANRAREEAERQAKKAEEAKVIAKEERRRRAEENERAIEEEKRRIAEEEAERQRRIEAYQKNLKAEQDAQDLQIFAERVKRRQFELWQEENEAQYRAEQLARQKKFIMNDALGDQTQEENGFYQAQERPEGEAGGTGLDELLQEQPEGAVYMGDGDIDLSGAQSGSPDDFFDRSEQPEGVVFTGDDDIDLSGAQSGSPDDFFERPEEEPEEIEEDAPDLKALLGDMEPAGGDEIAPEEIKQEEIAPEVSEETITLPKTRVASTYRPTEAEYKDKFVRAIGKLTLTQETDREFLADLFDARLVKHQKNPNLLEPDEELSGILEGIQKGKRKLNKPEDRRQTLTAIKESLDRIPEDRRVDAHKKASERVQKEIDRLPFIEEAERFGQDVYDKGWSGLEKDFRDLYLAGEGLDNNHPYRKLLEDMRRGESQSHPEFPAKRVMRGRIPQGGVIANLQTYDDLGKAKDLLEKEGINTPARQKALTVIERRQRQTLNSAGIERDALASMQGWLSLTQEQREKFDTLAGLMSKDPAAKQHKHYKDITTALKGLAQDPKECESLTRAKDHIRQLKQMKERLPQFIQDMTVDHPLFNRMVDALGFIDPDLSRQASDRAFATEMENLKVLKQNFAAVSKSYFGHTNSTEYNNMVGALDLALESKTPQELKEKKKNLADMTKAYLDHTGLKSASVFHKNAETRRKLAFLALHKCDSPERPWFKDYQMQANRVRKESDKIYVDRLLRTPGIGKALAGQVKEIDAAALANKVGANQPAKETHKRKVQPNTDNLSKDKEIEGPAFKKNQY